MAQCPTCYYDRDVDHSTTEYLGWEITVHPFGTLFGMQMYCAFRWCHGRAVMVTGRCPSHERAVKASKRQIDQDVIDYPSWYERQPAGAE